MKKQIIKCDFCKKELNFEDEKDGYYYDIIFRFTPGWVGMLYDDNEKQICNKCAKDKKIDFK